MILSASLVQLNLPLIFPLAPFLGTMFRLSNTQLLFLVRFSIGDSAQVSH